MKIKTPPDYGKKPLPPPPADWHITKDDIERGVRQGWLKPVPRRNGKHKKTMTP